MGFVIFDEEENSRSVKARLPAGWTETKKRNKNSWTIKDTDGLKRVLICLPDRRRAHVWSKDEAMIKRAAKIVKQKTAALFDLEAKHRELYNEHKEELAWAKNLLTKRGVSTDCLAEFEPPAYPADTRKKKFVSEDEAFVNRKLYKREEPPKPTTVAPPVVEQQQTNRFNQLWEPNSPLAMWIQPCSNCKKEAGNGWMIIDKRMYWWCHNCVQNAK
jgi:hypothetical protein